jgi:hypothetical protein
MYKEHAKRILDLFNKDVNRGVITAAETESALARLNAEIEESRTRAAEENTDASSHRTGLTDDDQHEASQMVSFSTRAYPFLEMLRAAHKRGCDIAWGI